MPAPRATAAGSRSRAGVQPPAMGGPSTEPGSRGICKDLTVSEEGLDSRSSIGGNSGTLCLVAREEQLLHSME